MPLGNPDQGQRISSLVEELVRKDKEREEREAMEGAPTYGPDLGKFMQATEQTEAQNAQELQRREAERERLRMQGLIAENKRNIPTSSQFSMPLGDEEEDEDFLEIDRNPWLG